jgi:hypothetical protein
VKKSKFGLNYGLLATAERDPNLSQDAKDYFRLLGQVETETDAEEELNALAELNMSGELEIIAELIQRNYIWIEGFPASVPIEARDMSAKAIRLRGLKQFFSGRPQ